MQLFLFPFVRHCIWRRRRGICNTNNSVSRSLIRFPCNSELISEFRRIALGHWCVHWTLLGTAAAAVDEEGEREVEGEGIQDLNEEYLSRIKTFHVRRDLLKRVFTNKTGYSSSFGGNWICCGYTVIFYTFGVSSPLPPRRNIKIGGGFTGWKVITHTSQSVIWWESRGFIQVRDRRIHSSSGTGKDLYLW